MVATIYVNGKAVKATVLETPEISTDLYLYRVWEFIVTTADTWEIVESKGGWSGKATVNGRTYTADSQFKENTLVRLAKALPSFSPINGWCYKW